MARLQPIVRNALISGIAAGAAAGHAGPGPKPPRPPDAALIDLLRQLTAEETYDTSDVPPPSFEFTIDGFAPREPNPGGGLWPYGRVDPKHPAIVTSADGTAAWVTADLDIHAMFYDGRPGYVSPVVAHAHGVLLADLALDSKWNEIRPTGIAANIGVALDAKATAKAIAAGAPAELESSIASDAQGAVDRFRASLADPAALVATLSARKDVTLLGSGTGERYTGAAVRTQLVRWGLAFSAHDGIRAGVAKSKSVAWVAANLDATPAKSPSTPAITYRALFLYERTGGVWQLVHLSFSMIDADIREHH